MPINARPATLASLLWLSACSNDTTVVIQPGAFSEDWPTELRNKLVKNNRCAIDQINQQSSQNKITIKSGEPLDIQGWAFSEMDGAAAVVYVQLVGPALTYTALAQERIARPDVIQHFQLDASWNPGFKLLATQSVEPSEYALEILQPDSKGVTQCRTGVILKIDPP